MMHTTVSAPQRLPPRPPLNNFHLTYCLSPPIANKNKIQKFTSLFAFFFLCESRADCQFMDPSTIVAIHDLVSRKQDQHLVVTSKRSRMANHA